MITLAAASYVGGRFHFTVPGLCLGAAIYLQSGFGSRVWAFLIHRTTSDLDIAQNVWNLIPPVGDQWRRVWWRKVVRIVPGDDYDVAFLMHTPYARQTGALGAPVTHGQIMYINGWQSTNIDPTSIAPTYNTNANGVDVLFRPD